jgi:hypothetical protein
MAEMRERRTLPVVILDATLTFFVALQSGRLPWSGRIVPRRAVIWTTVGGVAAVAGTVALLVTFLHSPGGLAPLGVGSPPPAAAEPPPTAAPPSATARPVETSPSAQPGGTVPNRPDPAPPATTPAPATTGPAPGPPAPLTGTYAVAEGGQGLLGYRASVTIANPAPAARRGWVLVLTLPRPSLTVDEVTGATARRDGATWTFTPDASTVTVPAGGSVRVDFQVRGATLVAAQPTGCAVDGARCGGL